MYQQTSQQNAKLVNVHDIVESYIHERLHQQYENIDDFDIEITWPANAFTHTKGIQETSFTSPSPTLQLLNSQSFRNASAKTQMHHFRASRSSRASTTASVLQGLLLPSQGYLIDLPDGAPWSDLQLHDHHSTVNESQQWDVDTPVKVPPGTVSNAQLFIQETNQSRDLTIVTEMRGKVIATVKQHGRLVGQIEENLVNILKHSSAAMYINEDTLAFETVLQLDVRYGITQQVKIEEAPIMKTPPSDVPQEEDFSNDQRWTNGNPKLQSNNGYTRRDYDDIRLWVGQPSTPYYYDSYSRPSRCTCPCVIM